MRLDDRGESSSRWLTVLHVAYRDEVAKVHAVLDPRVECEKPDLILVTMNNSVEPEVAYSAPPNEYTLSYNKVLPGNHLKIQGNFLATTEFRRKLYAEHIAGKLSKINDAFVKFYLTQIDTRWIAPKSDTRMKLWYRQDDDLPW